MGTSIFWGLYYVLVILKCNTTWAHFCNSGCGRCDICVSTTRKKVLCYVLVMLQESKLGRIYRLTSKEEVFISKRNVMFLLNKDEE